jgi:predicted RNA-binding Zn ribbon-like protein
MHVPTIDSAPLLGGALSLDFANTVEPRDEPDPLDLFRDRDDVLRWGIRTGLLPKGTLRSRRSGALAAASELARARSLREAVYAVLVAVARGREPSAEAMELLETGYAQAIGRSELVLRDGDYVWQTTAAGVDAVLDCVAHDAVELLRSPARARIKQCGRADGGCGWLFLDTTKSGTRRWCSMQICGSRAKAARQRSRQRGA